MFPHSLAQRLVNTLKIGGLTGKEQKSKTEIFSNKTEFCTMQESSYTEQQSMMIEAPRKSPAKNLPCRRASLTGTVQQRSPSYLTSFSLGEAGQG